MGGRREGRSKDGSQYHPKCTCPQAFAYDFDTSQASLRSGPQVISRRKAL